MATAGWLAALVLVGLAASASAQVSVELPPEALPGQPFEVAAVVEPGIDVVQVELLYRSAAAPEIQALLMQETPGRRYRAAIPGEHVVPPGVELVVRLRDPHGQTRLLFRAEPEQPYMVPVSGTPGAAFAPPPPVELVPAPGRAVIGRRPTLVIRVGGEAPAPEPGQVMVTIDGVDVTPQLEIVGREIRLRPASALAPGPHEAVVTFLDGQGQPRAPLSWPFTVRDYAAVQEGSLGVALSGTYEYATNKLLATDPRWKANANLHLEGRLVEGGFEASLGADLRYIDQHPGNPPGTDRDIDLAHHLLTLLYGQGGVMGRFELGDVAVRESMLTTGPSFARRGGQVFARARDTELRLFSVSAVPLFGWDRFTGLEESDQRVQGLSLSHGLLGEQLSVKLTALEGRNTPTRKLGETGTLGLPAYNIGSAVGGFEARTYSFSLSSTLLGGRLRAEAEGAWAQRLLFSAAESGALGDERGWQSDGAWRTRLEGGLGGVRAGAEYQHVGVDFVSPANPTLVADRSEAALDFQTSWWLTSWQLRLSRGHDNVRDTAILPRTMEWKLAPSVTLFAPGAPSLTLAYLRSDQRVDRPLLSQSRRVLTQAGTAVLSHATPTWFASLAPSYQHQEAMTPARESDTWTTTAAAGVMPAGWLTVSPSYTYTRTRDLTTHTIIDTHVPTLTARVELLPGLLTLDTQSSYVATVDNKDTVDTGTIASLARLTLSLRRFFPGGVAPSVGVRVNYTRTTDDLVATNTREDYGVFLIFDILASVGLLPRPGLDWQPTGGGTVGAGPLGGRF